MKMSAAALERAMAMRVIWGRFLFGVRVTLMLRLMVRGDECGVTRLGGGARRC
jgi:hypothetical protein